MNIGSGRCAVRIKATTLLQVCLLAGAVNGLVVRAAEAQTLSSKLKQSSVSALAKAAREKGDAVRGAVLFPQQKLSCANCHLSGRRDLVGPDLAALGKEATDEFLVESLLFPSKSITKGYESTGVTMSDGRIFSGRIIRQDDDELVLREVSAGGRLLTLKKGELEQIASSQISAMPIGLVDQLDDRQQFLDLVKYLMELKAAGPSKTAGVMQSTGGEVVSAELQGLVLIDKFGCVSCHEAGSQLSFPAKRGPDLKWTSGGVSPRWLARFISDPSLVKAGTTMPHLLSGLDDDERRQAATELTQYIVSLGQRRFQRKAIDPAAAARGETQFHTVGCVACHSPRDESGAEKLPKVSTALGDLAPKYNVDSLVTFLENPHMARPSGRMPKMHLTHWEAIDLASYLLTPGADTPTEVEFRRSGELAERGKLRFAQLQCARCHDGVQPPVEHGYPSLSDARPDQGCLSGKPGDWPKYALSQQELAAIRTALRRGKQSLTNEQQIDITLTAFNCVACHQRGALGGVSAARDSYFQTENPNLGPQGRIPPRLTGVGAKLKPKWLRQVLVSGRSTRPYMKTRMPQFGADNVEQLVQLLPRIDRLSDADFGEAPRGRDARNKFRNTGHQMAGIGGLNCVACHTFQRKPGVTMSAVDLTEMTERLQRNWFYHYMRDPQRLSPNTVMPSFWPAGRAIRKDILDGDSRQQTEALWQYLLEGRQARAPRGLIRKPIELVATDEAVMLRRSYQGIGKRGIGVGYAGQVNLAFDAEQMRLAMVWKGKFADPGGVWRGQGAGTVRPLGSDLIRFTVGPELDDAVKPWSVDDGRPPKHRFKGYYLDERRRPTFMYRFDNRVDVEDYSVDIKNEQSGDIRIRRTLTFSSKSGRPNLVFRAAADKDISAEEGGVYRVGKTLRVHVDRRHQPQIVETKSGKQLQVPLNVVKGKSQLVLEYAW